MSTSNPFLLPLQVNKELMPKNQNLYILKNKNLTDNPIIPFPNM